MLDEVQPSRAAFSGIVQYPGQRDTRVAGEIGKHAKILSLVHQVQRPALNEQIDQQPLDRHEVAIARLGRRPGADGALGKPELEQP